MHWRFWLSGGMEFRAGEARSTVLSASMSRMIKM